MSPTGALPGSGDTTVPGTSKVLQCHLWRAAVGGLHVRVTCAGVAALAVALAAGLAGPTALTNGFARAATSRAKTVAVSPSPGDRFATPQTTISFRGVTPAALGSV